MTRPPLRLPLITAAAVLALAGCGASARPAAKSGAAPAAVATDSPTDGFSAPASADPSSSAAPLTAAPGSASASASASAGSKLPSAAAVPGAPAKGNAAAGVVTPTAKASHSASSKPTAKATATHKAGGGGSTGGASTAPASTVTGGSSGGGGGGVTVPTPQTVDLPPDGTYVYDMQGATQVSSPAGNESRTLPSTVTMATTRSSASGPGTLELDLGMGYVQEKVAISATANTVAITKISQDYTWGNGTKQTSTLAPVPGIPVGAVPEQDGLSVPVNWTDSTSYGTPFGPLTIVGKGTATESNAVVTTAGKTWNCELVTVTQALSGSAISKPSFFNLQIWLDPVTGIEVKRVENVALHTAIEDFALQASISLRQTP